MATPPPGSAIEQIMLRQMRDMALMEYQGNFFEKFVRPTTERLSDAIRFRIRRAPYAADTFQMLDDLGIEPAPRRTKLPREIKIVITRREFDYVR